MFRDQQWEINEAFLCLKHSINPSVSIRLLNHTFEGNFFTSRAAAESYVSVGGGGGGGDNVLLFCACKAF